MRPLSVIFHCLTQSIFPFSFLLFTFLTPSITRPLAALTNNSNLETVQYSMPN
uniref:Uncharacterized protein n=1 Tax=Anguilla anguilla TaxID=7936 RepID=A0A0E9QRJ0_ANGAN